MQRNPSMRGMLSYLLICFGSTWTIEIAALFAGVRFDQPGLAPLATLAVAMFMPALSATVVLRFITREGFAQAGLKRPPLRALGIAWILVVLALSLSYGIASALGLARFNLAHLATMPNGKPAPLEPRSLALVAFVSAGTINTLVTWLFTFGEELGWTGFMLPKLAARGPVRAALIYGPVWGLWHAPAIWGGYNYPGTPWLGIVCMMVLCTGIALLQTGLWLRTRSVLVTAFAHACLNSFAGAFDKVFVDVNHVLAGPTGLISAALFAGLGGLLIARARERSSAAAEAQAHAAG